MRNRDMFYQNTNASYNAPGMFIPPSGFNMNSEYQAYGQNVLPNQYMSQDNNDYEQRISRLERQVRNLDTRLQKIEQENINVEDNFYML